MSDSHLHPAYRAGGLLASGSQHYSVNASGYVEKLPMHPEGGTTIHNRYIADILHHIEVLQNHHGGGDVTPSQKRLLDEFLRQPNFMDDIKHLCDVFPYLEPSVVEIQKIRADFLRYTHKKDMRTHIVDMFNRFLNLDKIHDISEPKDFLSYYNYCINHPNQEYQTLYLNALESLVPSMDDNDTHLIFFITNANIDTWIRCVKEYSKLFDALCTRVSLSAYMKNTNKNVSVEWLKDEPQLRALFYMTQKSPLNILSEKIQEVENVIINKQWHPTHNYAWFYGDKDAKSYYILENKKQNTFELSKIHTLLLRTIDEHLKPLLGNDYEDNIQIMLPIVLGRLKENVSEETLML